MISQVNFCGAINSAPYLNSKSSTNPIAEEKKDEEKSENKNLAKDIAIVASAISASVVAGIILAKKGVFDTKAAEKITEAAQGDKTINAVKEVLSGDKSVDAVTSNSTPENIQRFVKFPDGSYKNFDKNGVLRFEKTADGAKKWYGTTGELLMEADDKGGKLYENGQLLYSTEKREIYDKKGKLAAKKYGDSGIIYYSPDGKTLNLSDEHFVLTNGSTEIVLKDNGVEYEIDALKLFDEILKKPVPTRISEIFTEKYFSSSKHRNLYQKVKAYHNTYLTERDILFEITDKLK